MFQTAEVPGFYEVFLKPLKYRTIWSPDSNILVFVDVGGFITCKGPYMECKTPKRSGVGIFY